ncbi:MAG: hypothetical protein RQ763_08035 [Sulfurimonas sp.]|uniref:hypothetical protein n=1 Tax=Sulfurimonas sp. TaxID=2022749 RepID=UPI0028CEBB18|nr:hypothetical protein [Sulfurimonas sp.]MDT8339134.1 hypothetical protein [Sulfurimonas sp.]
MKIKLKKKENQYAQVHVNMLRNRSLSLKAKGLGAVLESYSNDFEVSLKSIEIGSNDGNKSVRSAIKELEQGYYLFRFQTREKGGLFTTYWAFDSQKLAVGYLHEIISELEKVELITPEQLLQRGIPYGNAVTGMPSRVCRQRHPVQRHPVNALHIIILIIKTMKIIILSLEISLKIYRALRAILSRKTQTYPLTLRV